MTITVAGAYSDYPRFLDGHITTGNCQEVDFPFYHTSAYHTAASASFLDKKKISATLWPWLLLLFIVTFMSGKKEQI